MKPLTPVDQLFLILERRQQPMHVGGLQLFEFPEDAEESYVQELAEILREYNKPSPPFNQRLINKFGRPYWEEDAQFDLDHHFRHEALPHPGRIRELLSLVSAEHSALLDRERPLWEAHLIEGFSDRRFALYSKIHHSMVDGIAAMRLMANSLSTDPEARGLPPVWAQPPRKRTRPQMTPADAVGQLAQATSSTRKQLASIPNVAREIYRNVQKSRKHENHLGVFEAPHSILNERITGSRRFAAQSYPLDRMRLIAKAFGGTLNDVVLAVCGAALREYLIGQRALPDAPLIAMVPMSVRTEDNDDGNQIAMILANLGTHIADPSHRMETVMGSVREAKERCARMTAEEIVNYTALTLAPCGLNLLTGINPKWQSFNVIISNVPGPKEPLYWNGARLQGIYPVSIVLDRMALNITVTSYVDSLEFGFIACRRTLPSMQRLLDYVEKAIDELEVAAGIA
ncbi:MAG: WS/DGAT/MGAT family O-acyltransferase [Gammaproteobacteria bacterium]